MPPAVRRPAAERPRSIIQAFEHAPVALCISRHRVIVHCNDELARLLRCSREDLIGKSVSMLFTSEAEFRRRGPWATHVMERSGLYDAEAIFKRPDGSLFWAHVRGHTFNRLDPLSYAVWSFQELGRYPASYERLSPRERDVAAALVEGLSNKQIASRLALSIRTVEMHRARLMRKVGAKKLSTLLVALVNAD